jgi:hypothetical protein
VGQQQKVDRRWFKAERLGVFFRELATTLVQAAVNQDALAGALHHMAGAGHILISAVE